jgi:hypothetical protein
MTTATITPGTTLTARSICDYNCIFSAQIISRTKSMATVKAMGKVSKCKIYTDERGEFIFALGKYSMAPIFRG